jgi:antiviral helicase SLH1
VQLVETSLKELDESSCAAVEPTGEVDPTPLGKIMSYYYLSHNTIRYLVKHVKRDAAFPDVLSWISHATEYDELPVRHNEDLINAELSKALPIPADDFGLPMWDPHVKTFLLLQAHFSRIDLPISDYVGDLNSVLDQSIRIVQASIDVLTELGYLSSCETMITLLQAIKSGRWPTDSPLSLFPGVDVDKEKTRLEHPQANPRDLVQATTASSAILEKAARFAGVTPAAVKRFVEPVSRLPILQLDLGTVNAIGLALNLTRQNPARMQNGGIRIFAPRYPKPQTEGFFVILSYSSTDEIIALKRVGWHDPNRGAAGARGGRNAGNGNSRLHTSMKMTFPSEAQGKKVDITVHSDSYLGMKWKIEGVEVPQAPVVDAYDKGKEKAAVGKNM